MFPVPAALGRPVAVAVLLACSALAHAAHPQWVLSANENKLDLATGAQRVFHDAPPDSLTLLDFSTFPPHTRHLTNIPNTVLGPPSNVTFSPDGHFALVADSIVLDRSRTNGWSPNRHIHILDLRQDPPRITSTSDTGLQPSGIAFSPDGRHVATANRADGTVSAFTFNDGQLHHVEALRIADPATEVADVACSPDGRWVVASVNKSSVLAVLRWEGDRLVDTQRRISVYGRPYRVRFTPDGQQVLTTGAGAGNGDDIDALSIVEVRGDSFRTTQFLPLASGPESFELSPDGKLGVGVFMNGSNTTPGGPLFKDHGLIVLFAREGKRWVQRQTLPTGRIPEGVTFTPDGRHVVVQCHPDRELRIYRVAGSKLKDTGVRIPVPGMPSGMAAGPATLRR
jgi:DNA-binding beta-propeller fold protein YncE